MCLLPHACLQARKRAPGAIFVNLRCFLCNLLCSALVQTGLFSREAMMEQSPALRAMTEAAARRRKIKALKAQMEHLKEELQMVVAVEILMRQVYHNLDSALDLIEEFQNTRNGRQLIDSEGAETFQVESMRRMSLRMWQTAMDTTEVIDHKLWQSTQELEKLESELRRRWMSHVYTAGVPRSAAAAKTNCVPAVGSC